MPQFVDGPNPIKVAWRILRGIRTTLPPRPSGSATVEHSLFAPVLAALAGGGLPSALPHESELGCYIAKVAAVDPDTLSRDGALAYWLNLYNAGAVSLALEAFRSGSTSVLRLPGSFHRPFVTVAGEELSLEGIEHGKIRRFGDPRIHGALVCGSLSCPTLRRTPYTEEGLDEQLDHQMRVFLAGGGAALAGDGTLSLSRVLLWYGGDFVRPHRMPTFLPASKRRLVGALVRWLPDGTEGVRRVVFQDYDWGLGCTVR